MSQPLGEGPHSQSLSPVTFYHFVIFLCNGDRFGKIKIARFPLRNNLSLVNCLHFLKLTVTFLHVLIWTQYELVAINMSGLLFLPSADITASCLLPFFSEERK